MNEELNNEMNEVVIKKPRVKELESIRAIAFIATVFRHSLAGFIYDGKMDLFTSSVACLLLSIARFGTPTFLFVTGFVLLYNYETLPYGEFIKKRLTKVVIPYVLWSGIYLAFLKIASRQAWGNFSENLSTLANHIIRGSASYHLWFIIMILQFYILFPLFRRLVIRCKGEKKWVGLTIGIILYQIAAIWIYGKYLPGLADRAIDGTFLKELLTFRDRNFLVWILYFMMGAIFAVNFTEVKAAVHKYSKIIVFGAILSLSYILFVSFDRAIIENGYVTINYMLTSPINGRMIPYTFFAILSIFLICSKIAETDGKAYVFFKWVGKYSFGGYLVHAIYVSIFVRVVEHFMHGQYILIKVLITIIATFVFSIATTYLLSKIKLGKYLIGG